MTLNDLSMLKFYCYEPRFSN